MQKTGSEKLRCEVISPIGSTDYQNIYTTPDTLFWCNSMLICRGTALVQNCPKASIEKTSTFVEKVKKQITDATSEF